MEVNQIISKAREILQKALAGLEMESNKIDFKRKWYDLKDKPAISEFMKDISAIANTYGLEGFIIIGFDDKEKELVNSNFIDSGLNDQSEIKNLMAKNLSDVFNIEILEDEYKGNRYSIIYVPRTNAKPIFVKNYINKTGKGNSEQRIFVRTASSTRLATKYDLELMYYDNQNSQPDYSLEIDIINEYFFTDEEHQVKFEAHVNIENIGKRSIFVNGFCMDFFKDNEYLSNVNCNYSSINNEKEINRPYRYIVKPGDLVNFKINFLIYKLLATEVESMYYDKSVSLVFNVLANKQLKFKKAVSNE